VKTPEDVFLDYIRGEGSLPDPAPSLSDLREWRCSSSPDATYESITAHPNSAWSLALSWIAQETGLSEDDAYVALIGMDASYREWKQAEDD